VYTEDTLFLAIELGDAGTVLEDVAINDNDQLWDIFLGVVVALSHAEASFQFEVSNENNICVSHNRVPVHFGREDDENLRFGFSGVEITILDYGLSSATLPNGDRVYLDLDNDLALFRGPSKPQFDTYRRMRTHLFTDKRTHNKIDWHTDESRLLNNGHTWSEYIPYTNVLWIRYLLQYAIQAWSGSPEDLDTFKGDIDELQHRLKPQTTVKNGGFETAEQVLEYALEKGWITAEQLERYGSDASSLAE